MEIKRTESFCLNIDGNISRYADKNHRDLQAAAARGEGRNVICFRSVGIWRLPVARTYKDKNGVNRKATEIIAESIHFPVRSKKSNATASAPAANGTGASAGATPQYENVDLSDEDLPF